MRIDKGTALLALVLPYASVLCAQTPQPQPGPSTAVTQGSTAAPPTVQDLLKKCQEESNGQPAYEYCNYIAILIFRNGENENALSALVNLTPDDVALTNAYSIYQVNKISSEVDQKVATNRGQTKQVGSPAASTGSTSLVAKAAATNLFAVAVESGALTQTQSGNTIALQANPASLFRDAYLHTPQLSYLPQGGSILENFTVSAGIAANANSTTSVPATGSATSSPVNTATVLLNSSATKLSSLTVNYEFNKLTQHSIDKYLEKYNSNHPDAKKTHLFVQPDPKTSPVAHQASAIFTKDLVIQPDKIPADCNRASYTAIALEKGDPEAITKDAVNHFNSCFTQEVDAVTADPNVQNKLDADWAAYNQALLADIASIQKSLKNQISGWDLAAQYVFNKPVNQPETHDFRLIGSGDINKSAGSAWTVNGAASIYQDLPSGAQYGRLKDAQFSGELDKSWGTGSSAPVIALAGYGQYQSKPSVLNITASSVPSGITLPANPQVFLAGTHGWLGVIQVKTTVRVAGSQIPIAVKWSNKPDLLGKSKLGAQFGLNYDFSQLKQLIGQGSSGN